MPTFEVIHTNRSGGRECTEVEASDKYAAQEGFAKGSIQSLRQIPDPVAEADPDGPEADEDERTVVTGGGPGTVADSP